MQLSVDTILFTELKFQRLIAWEAAIAVPLQEARSLETRSRQIV